MRPANLSAVLLRLAALGLGGALLLSACSGDGADATADAPTITVYSGRSEGLIGPLIERFEDETGIDVRVRYGDTAALAAALLEEGSRSPADVFLAQDAGALGAVEAADLLMELPAEMLASVDDAFKSASDRWVGISGRARVIVASTALPDRERPRSIFDLTADQWRGRVGWAPTNGSFQAFVTAMRELHGDAATEQWLRDMLANDVQEYPRTLRSCRPSATAKSTLAWSTTTTSSASWPTTPITPPPTSSPTLTTPAP